MPVKALELLMKILNQQFAWKTRCILVCKMLKFAYPGINWPAYKKPKDLD